MTNKAFTLVEILVAVMLTGLLTTLALAPVVGTIRRVVDTQSDYSDYAALSRTMNFIARDLNSAMRLSANVFQVTDHEALGGHADDVLMVMSTSPAAQSMAPGTLVYKVSEGGIMHSSLLPGLYRWIFAGREPRNIDTDGLDPEEGQLVLPGVSDFSVEIPYGDKEDERRKSYIGPLPVGIVIRIKRGERSEYSSTKDDDARNELESTIVFP